MNIGISQCLSLYHNNNNSKIKYNVPRLIQLKIGTFFVYSHVF